MSSALAQESRDKRLTALSFGEDPASLRAGEAQPPLPHLRGSNAAVGAVTAVHSCPFSDMMMCGHSDGRVSVWQMPPGSPGFDAAVAVPHVRLVYVAHRGGAVAAVATTPWGAAWTGSTQGSLRIFPDACAQARSAEQGPPGQAAVMGVEARRSVGERAHGRVAFLALTASGQARARCLA